MSIDGLTGIASGVDTSAIIEKLMDVDRQQTTRLGLRKAAVTARQSGLSNVASELSALKLAAQDLASATTWIATQTVSSTDDAKVSATKIGGAGIGGHSVQVDRLASSAQRGFAFTPSATAGSFDIYYGDNPSADGATKVTINVPANATAQDVADAINGKGTAPAYATVLKDPATGEDRLVLSARKTGGSSAFTVDQTGMAAAMTEDTTYQKQDAALLNSAYRLDGSSTVLHSETNVVENAIPGVRLTFKAVTTTEPATVTVSPPAVDPEKVKTKAQAFVDAYNALVTDVRAKISEKTVNGATTEDDAAKGQLFGDTGLTTILSQLRSMMGGKLTGLTGVDELSDIGIGEPKSDGTVSQDAKDGKLVLDLDKLTEAMGTDSGKVREFFTSFSAKMTTYTRTQTGGGKGVLDGRGAASAGELTSLQDQIDRANDRMTSTETRLKAQFAAMESSLLQIQTQQSWLSGQIAQL
jgi:flagellar hook-associated protein 2